MDLLNHVKSDLNMEGFFTNKETQVISRPDGKRRTCVSCGLYKNCKSPKIKPTGGFGKQILNIFPAPDLKDDLSGKSFRNQQARSLRIFYKELGISLDEDCLNTYAIHCYSEEIKMTNVAFCRSSVLKLIHDKKPKVVVLFGNEALESIIGYRWKKDMGTIYKWRGWTIPDQDLQTWVIPVFDLKQVEENSNIDKVILKQDLMKVKECLNKPFPLFQEPKITVLPKRDLSKLNDIQNTTIAFDYETTGIKPHAEGHKIMCASVAINSNEVYVFEVPKNKIANKPFTDLLKRDNVQKVAQNMKYEDTWTMVQLKTLVNNWTFDTMLGTHVLDNRPKISGLKFQAYVQIGIIDYDSEVAPYLRSDDVKNANAINRIKELWEIPGGKEKLFKYCAYDSILEYQLYCIQMEEFKKRNSQGSHISQAYALLHDGTLALARAERIGLRINIAHCKRYMKKLSRKITILEDKIHQTKLYRHWSKTAGGKINLNSETQLGHFLYNVKKLKPAKLTTTGKGSTDEEALKMLKIPDLDLIIQRSKMGKIKDTYLESIVREQVDGILHPFFNLHIARTYRSSSNNPNFQNMPKRDKEAMKIVRQAIIPRPGHQLLEMDYGSIEVAIAAPYHKDPTMFKYLKTPSSDLHGDMVKQIFKIKDFNKSRKDHAFLRSCIKNSFVFPEFYGDYYKNCAQNICGVWTGLPTGRWKKGMGYEMNDGSTIGDHLLSIGINSYIDFENHLQKIEKHFWEQRFPVYAKWKERHWKKYQQTGVVKMYTGFECTAIMGKNNAINYPIQGTAFHCLLWSFVRLTKIFMEYRFDSKLVGQIHDSIIFDVNPKELTDVYKVVQQIGTKEIKKAYPWINVPLKIDAELCPVDGSWAEKEDWNPLEL